MKVRLFIFQVDIHSVMSMGCKKYNAIKNGTNYSFPGIEKEPLNYKCPNLKIGKGYTWKVKYFKRNLLFAWSKDWGRFIEVRVWCKDNKKSLKLAYKEILDDLMKFIGVKEQEEMQKIKNQYVTLIPNKYK